MFSLKRCFRARSKQQRQDQQQHKQQHQQQQQQKKGCLHNVVPSKGCLWILLGLVITSNIALFLVGSAIEPEQSLVDPGYIAMWKSALQPPPEGSTCEEWLSQEDALGSTRDYVKDWVKVHAEQNRVIPCNGLSCHYMQNTKDVDCDADLAGDDASCTLKALVQPHPEDPPLVINASNLITMGPGLDWDVPIGQPSWGEYSFMDAVPKKTASSPILAILNTHCDETQERMDIINTFKNLGTQVDVYGACFNDTSVQKKQRIMAQYKFALLFEYYARNGYMSPDYWLSLANGVVPVVVSDAPLTKFVPADNAYLQVESVLDIPKVCDWVAYLAKSSVAYAEMLRWKLDGPADKFLSILDMTAVGTECRLCLHVATRLMQQEVSEQDWPCRCQVAAGQPGGGRGGGAANHTLYHLFVRERGRFNFHTLFIRSTELTVSSLVKSVYRLFKSSGQPPVWAAARPPPLAGPAAAAMLRAFRIYPVGVSQEMALVGTAAFKTDDQFRSFVEATPCPQLEVIFL